MTVFHARQAIAVLSTYASWWFVWLVLGVYAVGIVLNCVADRDPGALSPSVNLDFSGQPFNHLPVDLSTVDSIVLNPDQLVEALEPQSCLRIAGALPNLKRLVVFASLNESQLVLLLEHLRLKSLVLFDLDRLSEPGWAALESQPLEELQILSMDRSHWAEARWPATARTLLVSDYSESLRERADSPLESLVRLPSLQILKVRLLPNANGRLRTADRDALLQMPSIRWLYIDQSSPSFLREVQKELPRIAVRPTSFNSGRVYRVMIVAGLSLLPVILILNLVSLQFVTQASVVVPDFHRRHWSVAVSLMICCGLVQTIAMVAAGCELMTAASLACVGLVPACLVAIGLEQASRFPGFTQLPFIFLLIAPYAFVALMVSAHQAEIDWIIGGHYPILAPALIVLELLSLFGLSRFFARLCRRLSDGGEIPAPFALWDLRGLEHWSLRSPQALRSQERIWGAGQERRLAAALRSPKTSSNHQSLLWHASHQMTAGGFAICMSAAMIIGVSLVVPFTPAILRTQSTMWSLWMQVTIFLWMLPYIRLMQQRSFLSRHLLASCGRREWVRLIFRETARDFVPAVFGVTLGLAAYCRWGSATWWPAWHVAALAVAGLGVAYGISLLLVTYSPTTQIAIALGAFVAPFGLVLLPLAAASQFWPDTVEGLFYVPPIWWIPLVAIAAFLIYAADRRWKNWELASIS